LCFGALEPKEIVVIGARGNRESEGLANYYARVRGVPPENICLVDMPNGELLPRETWKWGVRPEIRKWLIEHDPKQEIRCLLTVWGVPLKIGPSTPDDETRKYQEFLEAERSHRVELLGVIERNLEQLAVVGELPREVMARNLNAARVSDQLSDTSSVDVSSQPTAGPPLAAPGGEQTQPPATAADSASDPTQSALQQLRSRLEKALQAAQLRLAKLAAGDVRTRGQVQLQQLAAAAGGASVILQGLNQRITANPESIAPGARSDFDALRGRASAFSEVRLLLDQMPPSIERDAMVLAILERIGGLLSSVQWLDEQLKVVAQNETGASFDSELALVLWPDDYQLLRWQPNYLRASYDNSQLPKAYRTFMVARLDAPTLRLAKGLVDTAIQVENEGLRGKVYLDGRGMAKIEDTNLAPGSYADYDKALLVTAKGIEEQTTLEVVLDTSPELFQPGSCPEAALYCGWYSLAKYIDAFEWKPGAVAYHLASGEAQTLRDPGSQAWCKKLLEDGVCATIGPVYEPYLGSFPRPNDFFALLLRGDFTLVECYARTAPFNSWMITLIGDPLYRPFRNRPPIKPPAERSKPPAGQTPDATLAE
jgi:uncharacterized protein (TIGR03790 family)